MARYLIIFLMWLMAGAVFGCNSSPTVPVPPPAATLIKTSTPDADGFVTVTGDPDDRFGFGDVALIYNDNTGDGIMTDIETDGSFRTKVSAEFSHVLVIKIMRGDSVSGATEIQIIQVSQ